MSQKQFIDEQFSDDILRLVILWRALRFAAQKVNSEYQDIAVQSLSEATLHIEGLTHLEIHQIYQDIQQIISFRSPVINE